MKIECFCGAGTTIKGSNNLGEMEEQSGYLGVADISNGLTFLFLCPACWKKCKPALQTLIEVFGEKASYIHITSLIRKVERGEE